MRCWSARQNPRRPLPRSARTPPTRQAESARSTANGGEPTKAELYERAQQLGIEGRSRMSKAELQAAISRRG